MERETAEGEPATRAAVEEEPKISAEEQNRTCKEIHGFPYWDMRGFPADCLPNIQQMIRFADKETLVAMVADLFRRAGKGTILGAEPDANGSDAQDMARWIIGGMRTLELADNAALFVVMPRKGFYRDETGEVYSMTEMAGYPLDDLLAGNRATPRYSFDFMPLAEALNWRIWFGNGFTAQEQYELLAHVILDLVLDARPALEKDDMAGLPASGASFSGELPNLPLPMLTGADFDAEDDELRNLNENSKKDLAGLMDDLAARICPEDRLAEICVDMDVEVLARFRALVDARGLTPEIAMNLFIVKILERSWESKEMFEAAVEEIIDDMMRV